MSATERYGYDLTGDLARAAQELDAAFAGAWAPNLKTMVKATRTYGYFGGPELQLDGTVDWFVNGTIVCPDNTLCLVQREPYTGTVVATDPPVLLSGYRPMAVVRCVSGNLTRFVDARDAVLGKGARFLDDLEDVSLYDLAQGDGLLYDATLGLWINSPDVAGVGAATSVIGRAANSVGPVASIAALTDGVVLRRLGGVLGFGPLTVGAGVGIFPDVPPDVPSAYDDEGLSAALAAIWTEIATPGGGFTKETTRNNTYLALTSPGAAASNAWHIRQPIQNADGDYNTPLLVTAKLALSAFTGAPNVGISLGDNAALSTGNFVNMALAASALTRTASAFDGALTSITLPVGTGTIYLHYQRNTAATNNVRIYYSYDGIGWTRFYINSLTWNVDYLFAFFQGHTAAAAPSLNMIDWIRVNDSRFLQNE